MFTIDASNGTVHWGDYVIRPRMTVAEFQAQTETSDLVIQDGVADSEVGPKRGGILLFDIARIRQQTVVFDGQGQQVCDLPSIEIIPGTLHGKLFFHRGVVNVLFLWVGALGQKPHLRSALAQHTHHNALLLSTLREPTERSGELFDRYSFRYNWGEVRSLYGMDLYGGPPGAALIGIEFYGKEDDSNPYDDDSDVEAPPAAAPAKPDLRALATHLQQLIDTHRPKLSDETYNTLKSSLSRLNDVPPEEAGAIARKVQAEIQAPLNQFLAELQKKHPASAPPTPEQFELWAHEGRAAVLFQQKDFTAAEDAYSTAIRLAPQKWRNYYERAIARRRLDDLEGAIADFSDVLRLKPDSLAALINRGVSYSELDNYAAASADFDQALAVKPDESLILENRGTVRAHMGDFAGAEHDLKGALALKPGTARMIATLGWVALRKGDYAAAMEHCNEALRLNPEEGSAYYTRGSVNAAWGNTQAAIEDYQQAQKHWAETLKRKAYARYAQEIANYLKRFQ